MISEDSAPRNRSFGLETDAGVAYHMPMIVPQPARQLIDDQIRRYGPHLSGMLVDLGAGQIRRYKKHCPNVHEYKTLDHDDAHSPDIVGSCEAVPLPDASVDSVLCTQVLEHLPHPWIAVKECFRILKPGGKCLLTAPQTNELHELPHDYYRYTNHGMRVLFEDAGFSVDVIEQSGGYYAMMAQLRIRHAINGWKPYERRAFLAPVTLYAWILTKTAYLLDGWFPSEENRWHTIGWCVLATKP